MKEDNDIFKKFRDSFSKIDGHFHILESACTRRTADGIF